MEGRGAVEMNARGAPAPLVVLHDGDSQVKDTTLGFDQQSGLSIPKCLGLVLPLQPG